MPDTAITAAPFIIEHPFVRIGPTGAGAQIDCAGTHLTADCDQDENTVETFCGSYTSYKAPKWTITFTVAQSYGAGSSWELIHPLCGTIVPFEIRPDDGAAAVGNPVMSGTALIKQLPFIDADPGTASEVDLEMKVQGLPLFGSVSPTEADATSEPQTAAA